MRFLIGLCLLACSCPFLLRAETNVLRLTNGDRIRGEIVSETEASITLLTEAMGPVTVDKSFIKPAPDPEKDKWQRNISAGYSKTAGNTQSSVFSGELNAHKKSNKDEKEIKADVLYSSSDKKMDAQSWYFFGRYGRSFGEQGRCYYFYKLEADHDRFSNINYRLIPSVGPGCWFSDTDDLRAFAECGLGFSHADHTDNSKDSNELLLVPRAFYQQRLRQGIVFVQDITFYPSLEDADEYRLHSETSLVNPINDALALKLSLIDDYDADPAEGIKKNDMKFISSLVYSF